METKSAIEPVTFGEWFEATTANTEQLRFALHFIPAHLRLQIPNANELRVGVPILTNDGHFAEVAAVNITIEGGFPTSGHVRVSVAGVGLDRSIPLDRIRSAGRHRGGLVELLEARA